ncbi:MAG TPA: S26 family signal peptidase [Gemmatimonadales bacterium]|nr:S26 family signal peptidase [Gemmatimonadales bacterium]
MSAFAVIAGIELFRFVLTPSLPRGVYLAREVGAPETGLIVSFCPPPALGRALIARRLAAPGYCPGGSVPLAKRIAAIAPFACAGPEGVVINSRLLSWPRLPKSLGLPRFDACGPTPPDCAFVVGDSADSIDSRVFGCIPVGSLRNRLIPILTERGVS